MCVKDLIFTASDGVNLSLTVWDEVENAKAVVVIGHGMAEHIGRYDGFAQFLNGHGFIVVGADKRGHGKTDPGHLGLTKGLDLFERTAMDDREIAAHLKGQYNLPLIAFMHSYGSFIMQRNLYEENPYTYIVLSGSAFMGGAIVSMGRFLAKLKGKKKQDTPGKMFARMTFKSYDKKFKQGLNGWISRDLKEVGKYNADPLCGFICSVGFYLSFFTGLKKVEKGAFLSCPDKNAKILILSGSNDMVGGKGKLVAKLSDKLTNAGFAPEVKLFEGGRHELLNEKNKKEVYDFLLERFDAALSV